MAKPKDKHLHIRWSDEDEENLQFIMKTHRLKKSEAVRYCVNKVANLLGVGQFYAPRSQG